MLPEWSTVGTLTNPAVIGNANRGIRFLKCNTHMAYGCSSAFLLLSERWWSSVYIRFTLLFPARAYVVLTFGTPSPFCIWFRHRYESWYMQIWHRRRIQPSANYSKCELLFGVRKCVLRHVRFGFVPVCNYQKAKIGSPFFPCYNIIFGALSIREETWWPWRHLFSQ